MATVAQSTGDLQFERASGRVGAWVRGFDPLAGHDAGRADILARALAEYGVLFFDFGRLLEERELIDFASIFGTVQARYGQSIKDQVEEAKVPYIDNELVPMEKHHQNRWHGDGGPFERPPLAAMLTPLEVPHSGGDTMWASMVAAYEALSPHMQAMLDGMQIVNNNSRLPLLEPREFVQPAIVRNPITGRKSLYVDPGYTEKFVGVPQAESDALLRFLFEHINTPEFHVRLNWRIGYAAVWHQQVTKHRGVNDFTGPRKLKRLTIEGERLLGHND